MFTAILLSLLCLSFLPIFLVVPVFAETEILSITGTDGYTLFVGGTLNSSAQSVLFSRSYNVSKISLRLGRAGTPTVNITIDLFAASAGDLPTGSSLATSNSINASTLSTSTTWYNFTFPTFPTLDNDTLYCFVLSCNTEGTLDDDDRFWHTDSTALYSNGKFSIKNSGIWVLLGGGTYDMILKLYGEQADQEIPTFSAITANSTVSGSTAQLNCTVSDDYGVSGYIFSYDNGNGTWLNATWTSGTSATSSFNWTDTVGNTGHGKVYANDTSDNWGTSDQYNFTLTADTYTVTLTPSSYTETLDRPIIVTFGISRTTGAAVTNYKLNITKDGTLYKENFTDPHFAEVEMNPTGHRYNVTGLVDEDASASVTPTCTEITLTWMVAGPGGEGSNQNPYSSLSTVSFQIDALSLGVVQPNSTVTATLHFSFTNSSFSLFSLNLGKPFASWYVSGLDTHSRYSVDATGQGEGSLILNFNIPSDSAFKTYSSTITVQAIDQAGTVYTSTADITAKVSLEGSGIVYWIRTHLAYVFLAILGVLAGLACIAVFVRRRR